MFRDLYDPLVMPSDKAGQIVDDEDCKNLTQQAKREAQILDGLSRYVFVFLVSRTVVPGPPFSISISFSKFDVLNKVNE